MREEFIEEARLMLRVLPYVATEECFALKGGTAINFFVRDMPRLSVDIDLTYLPLEGRDESLKNIGRALSRIKAVIGKTFKDVKVQEIVSQGNVSKLVVKNAERQIKVEPNMILRGSTLAPVERDFSRKAEEMFGLSVSMKTLATPDLFGGKICAALDRQHPRDLFDVKLLLENEGLTPEIRRAFIVYLVSHDRPMHELLNPPRKNVQALYEAQMKEMTDDDVSYEALCDARERLITQIMADLSEAEKRFIMSVKEGTPQWDLMGIDGLDRLPAIQWKLKNIGKMDPAKHRDQVEKLKKKLGL